MDREVIKAVSRLSSIEWDHHLFSMNCDVIHLNEVPLLKIMDTLKKREAIAYVCFNEAMPLTPNTLTASEANKKLMVTLVTAGAILIVHIVKTKSEQLY